MSDAQAIGALTIILIFVVTVFVIRWIGAWMLRINEVIDGVDAMIENQRESERTHLRTLTELSKIRQAIVAGKKGIDYGDEID